MTPKSFPRRKILRLLGAKKLAVLLVLAVAPLVILPMGVLAIPEKELSIPPEGFAAAVTEPFRLTVTGEGTVESRRNATLISQCEWSTRIIKLLPEGTWVEPGDVVVELDSTEIRKKMLERRVLLVQAKSKLVQAEEDLRIQRLLNENSIAEAQLKAKLARLDLQSYVDAEFPRQLHQAEGNVALAEEALVRARKQHEFVNNMVRLGYRSSSDAERERLAVMKAQQAFEQAKRQLNVLAEYGHQRDLAQLTGQAEDLASQLERTKLMAEAAVMNLEARLHSAQKTHHAHQSYLDRLQRSYEACTLRATQSGEVVYATTSPRSNDKIDMDSTAYYMRPLVHIPDRSRLDVSLRVHETLIRHLKVGQTATVEINAVKRTPLPARVTSVSTIPLAGRFPYLDLREYRVTVEIDEDPAAFTEIAPGMTASVEILAAHKPTALTVPVESVFEMGGRYFVFVQEGDDVVEREIEIGLSNEESIEVLGGLEDGEQVVLQPRARCSEMMARLESRFLGAGWGESL